MSKQPKQLTVKGSSEKTDKTTASRTGEKELLQSIGLYLFNLAAVQERVFGLFGDEDGVAGQHATTYKNFYDFSKLDGHTALFKDFANCFERAHPPSVLTIFAQWSRYRLEEASKSPIAVLKKQLSCAKLVAGLCFLHAHYYDALQCLLHVVRIDRGDTHCWYLLLRWLLWLDEGEAVGVLLAEEKRVTGTSTKTGGEQGSTASKDDAGYSTMIAVTTLLHRLQTLPEGADPSRIVNGLLEKLEAINARRNERMTYALCHSKAMIKEAMVLASRFPRVDLKKIGDPLQNRSEQVEICDAVLRNRFPPFFNSQASRSLLQRKAADPDEFLKICASVADYCEASRAMVGEYFDTGLTREVEAHTVAGIKYLLPLGIPHRVIQPAAFLLFEKSILTLEQEQFPAYASMINSLFTPRTSAKKDYLPDAADEVKASAAKLPLLGTPSSSATDDVVEDSFRGMTMRMNALVSSFSMNLRIESGPTIPNTESGNGVNNNEEGGEDKENFELLIFTEREVFNGHVEGCVCGFCSLLNSDPLFSLQCAWLQMVEAGFTLDGLGKFKSKLDKAVASVNKTRSELMKRVFPSDSQSAAPVNDLMPSQLADLWMRTSLTYLLKYSETSGVSDAESIKSLLKICERNIPKWRGEWLLLRTLTLTTSREDVTWGYMRMKEFGHLFYREWRFRNSALLATGIDEPWHKAMYWVESATPCIRQYSRLVNYKKGDLSGSYYYDTSAAFKEAIGRLPEDFTLVNLALDKDGSLVVSRLHREHEPVIARIGKRVLGRQIVEKVSRLLGESEKSVSEHHNDAEKFWRVRRRLDNEMKVLVWEMQNKWLAGHVNLFAPYPNHGSSAPYVLLVVPPQLSFLPWECMPLFEETLVTRVPSFHFFDNLLCEVDSLPKPVDARKSYYVLNPGGDLAKSQERLAIFMDKFKWPGLVGEVPTRDQVQKALQLNDLFLYMGHGSGGRYFGRSSIRESRCKAVSILMGCCSARIVDEGPRFDGRASLYEYLIAKCPCVVGCLWTVTDGDIDRFFMALVDSCFSQFVAAGAIKGVEDEIGATPTTAIATAKSSKAKRGAGGVKLAAPPKENKVEVCQILLQGIVKARKACKLPYLTGASVTSYGLPISSLHLSPTAINKGRGGEGKNRDGSDLLPSAGRR